MSPEQLLTWIPLVPLLAAFGVAARANPNLREGISIGAGVILFLLPLVMAGVLTLLNRSYMSALFTSTLGQILIGAAAVLQILGGLVITRMLRVDF